MTDKLSTYFKGVAYKRLSGVEISTTASNQHELNGTKQMQSILGTNKNIYEARFLFLGDSDEDTAISDGTLTWYDAREAHPTRTEWRLYYKDSEVFSAAEVNDLLVLARTTDDELILIIAQANSTAENQLYYLFDLDRNSESTFQTLDLQYSDEQVMDFAREAILGILDIAPQRGTNNWLEQLLSAFGRQFPTTAEFSQFARESLEGVDPISNPDLAMTSWFLHEEKLFRTLEEHLVWDRIQDGFDSVDDYISSSLSVLNRRKSRAGHAAENQLEQVFINNNVSYSRGKITEGKSRPDFLFPGIQHYQNPEFPSQGLQMLGVKTTCKDRWRQVLAEASRIENKHLFTLEPGISENQTNEMARHSLTLVVPSQLHESFSENQQKNLMSLKEFIDCVRRE